MKRYISQTEAAHKDTVDGENEARNNPHTEILTNHSRIVGKWQRHPLPIAKSAPNDQTAALRCPEFKTNQSICNAH